jgi:ActR/RegA family two-component response regulator
VSSVNSYLTFDINALILCNDTHFLTTLERVFRRLGVRSERCCDYSAALSTVESRKTDAIVIDWGEILNLGEFLDTLRRSKMNRDCLLIGIASDLLDLRQAFSAGVQFLIHKPASVVQIAGCLQAAHATLIAKRRKQHREPVRIAADLHTRSIPLLGALIVNLGAEGAGLKLNVTGCKTSAGLSAGDEIDLRFVSPGSRRRINASGVVAWVTPEGDAGVHFKYLPESERPQLEQWLGERFEQAVLTLRDRVRVEPENLGTAMQSA